MWVVGTGVAHSSIPQKKYEVSHGIFPGQVMAVCKSKLSFDLLETRGSSYFSSEHTVYFPVKTVH